MDTNHGGENGHAGKRPRCGSDSDSNKFILDKNERLLRLNVGGFPFDVVRTSLPLLETMMTDRWLSSCLVDSDGRIFIDRDGDSFGDILRYLRGGADFLRELARAQSLPGTGRPGAGWPGDAARRVALGDGGRDRLRRLRTEADYYGLHQLVRDIDVVTVGEKVILADIGWARVAGGCPPRGQRENELDGAGGGAVRAGGDNGRRPRGVEEPNNDHQVVDEEEDDDENDNNNEESDDNDDNEDEEAEEDEEDDEEEEEDPDDSDRPRPYRHWSWSRQFGNPAVLRPHPNRSSMIVGQDGTYLLLLRLAAALQSPLARIRWDAEEEEGRRVTRGALRRRRHEGNHDEHDDGRNDGDGDHGGRSKELEEDYFVTVNIEAPLQTGTVIFIVCC